MRPAFHWSVQQKAGCPLLMAARAEQDQEAESDSAAGELIQVLFVLAAAVYPR